MASNITMTLGSYSFDPVPVLSISTQFIRTQAGQSLNQVKTANFSGILASFNKTNEEQPICLMQNMERALYECDDCVKMDIKCDGTSVMMAWVRIQEIQFGESRDNWTITIPITFTLEWDAASETLPAITGTSVLEDENGNVIFVDEDGATILVDELEVEESSFDNSCLACLRDAGESWDVRILETPAVVNTAEGPSGCQTSEFIEVTHNVNATAVNCCTGSGTTADLTSGWVASKSWVEAQLGFDSNTVNANGIFNWNPSNFQIFNHVRSINADHTGGSYSCVETWIVVNSLTGLPCTEEYTVNCERQQASRLLNYNIQGQIQGLEQRNSSTYALLNSKIENAKTAWTTIQTWLTDRIECCCDVDSNCPLNPVPDTYTIGFSPNAGTVSYQYVYTDRPVSLIRNSISENIQITDVKPSEQVSVIPIPGRQAGPILFSCNTIKQRQKSINLEVVLPYPSGCIPSEGGLCSNRWANMQMTASQEDAIEDFLCCIESSLMTVNDFVARIDDNISEDPINGVYGRNVVWTYQNCSDTVDDTLCDFDPLEAPPEGASYLYEGTVTSYPTTVSTRNISAYQWDVDTDGGDVNITSIPIMDGVCDGAELSFRNDGKNDILWTGEIDGSGYTWTISGAGSILNLVFDEDTGKYHILG